MVETRFVKAADGETYAYRLVQNIGISSTSDATDSAVKTIPLVMHMHFRANMDFWDPALVAPLAEHRLVVLFDNRGVGRTSGSVPCTYKGWARGVLALVEALGLREIDLFGFSMGGRCVQEVALLAPSQNLRIRKLICAGTDTSRPAADNPLSQLSRGRRPLEPFDALNAADSAEAFRAAIRLSFFYDTPEGQHASDAYFERISSENNYLLEHDDKLFAPLDRKRSDAQVAAAVAWSAKRQQSSADNAADQLHTLEMPVLVMNGDNDLLIPTPGSWQLASGLPNAQLIIYPRAGHGFLWQYPAQVARHICDFLDSASDGRRQRL